MAVRFDMLHPLCAPELPAVPVPTLDAHINLAWRQFAQKTRIWKGWQDVFLDVGEREYMLDGPEDGTGAVDTVERVIAPNGMEMASAHIRDDMPPAANGMPTSYRLSIPTTLVLTPAPDASNLGTVRVLVVYGPTLAARNLPNHIADNFSDVIATGAKASLMAMSAATWASPNHAVMYLQQFEAGIANAIAGEIKGNVVANTFVPPRAFC